MGGTINVPALFSEGYFSIKKGVWRPEISWLFQSLKKFQKIFFFWFSQCLGDLEGVDTLCPPRTQATFKSPALLGLRLCLEFLGLYRYFNFHMFMMTTFCFGAGLRCSTTTTFTFIHWFNPNATFLCDVRFQVLAQNRKKSIEWSKSNSFIFKVSWY